MCCLLLAVLLFDDTKSNCYCFWKDDFVLGIAEQFLLTCVKLITSHTLSPYRFIAQGNQEEIPS